MANKSLSSSSTSVCLTKQEIREITEKKHFSAQVRVLAQMGINYKLRPDGSPVVFRFVLEQIMGTVTKNKSKKPDFSSLN